MKDILLPQVRAIQQQCSSGVVRIEGDVFHDLKELSYKTAIPMGKLAAMLMRESMKRVRLVERSLYEMQIMEEGEQDDEL